MRLLLSAIIVAGLAVAMRAQTRETQNDTLGSTMTLEQQGAKSAKIRAADKTKVLTVHAKNEPTPALKYRLWMPTHTLKPGSAQLHFSRALLLWHDAPKDIRNKSETWSDENPPKPGELKEVVERLSAVFDELHLLATSEDTDWDHRLRDLRGLDLYSYLQPGMQQARILARALNRNIQYQVSQGDIEGAVRSLRDGFRLAAFVGQGETLVHKLVGIAIEGVMLTNVEHLTQVEDGPNLYWALATLPRPLVSIRNSLEFELNPIHRVFPVLDQAESQDRDEAYWNAAWGKFINDWEALVGEDIGQRSDLALVGVSAVQPAKRRLIESGMDAKRVESMPPLQAVFIDASREIRRVADNLTKAIYLPDLLGSEILDREEQRFSKWYGENRFKSVGAAMAGMFFPAVSSAQTVEVRQEFLVNRLMTIEAIRMHAATHNGQVPATLDDLSPVPALPNPFTGKPFDYSVAKDGGSSVITLSADTPRLAEHLKEIRIRLNN